MKRHNKSRFATPIPFNLTSFAVSPNFYCKRPISQGYFLLTKCHLLTAAPRKYFCACLQNTIVATENIAESRTTIAADTRLECGK
ncbi:MAG: hypothetical protein WBY93_05300 [Candidatus Binatus sp.]